MPAMNVNGMESMQAAKLRGAAKPLHGAPKATEAQITAKAEEFEAVFLSQMLSHMFDGIETDEMFGGGHGEDAYKSMMVEEYGKIIAKTGGIGVADHVKAEMIRLQEMQP
jgi:Rod binding domain-containing protein